MKDISIKNVLRSMNSTGWIVSIAALALTLALIVVGITTVAYNGKGCFRQIFDESFCGLYTIEKVTIPSAINDALNTLSTPATVIYQDPDGQVIDTYPLNVGADDIRRILPITYRYLSPTTALTLDQLGAGAFMTDFLADPMLQSSCWEKVALDDGNYYVFIGREAAEAAYSLISSRNQPIQFLVPLQADPLLRTDVVRFERAIVRQLSESRQERVEQVVLMIFMLSLLAAFAVIVFWKKCVYNSVRTELYMSFAYDADYELLDD